MIVIFESKFGFGQNSDYRWFGISKSEDEHIYPALEQLYAQMMGWA